MISFAIDMAKGVKHLHSQGYIHRDISLRNFLLENDENDIHDDVKRKTTKGLDSPPKDSAKNRDQYCASKSHIDVGYATTSTSASSNKQDRYDNSEALSNIASATDILTRSVVTSPTWSSSPSLQAGDLPQKKGSIPEDLPSESRADGYDVESSRSLDSLRISADCCIDGTDSLSPHHHVEGSLQRTDAPSSFATDSEAGYLPKTTSGTAEDIADSSSSSLSTSETDSASQKPDEPNAPRLSRVDDVAKCTSSQKTPTGLSNVKGGLRHVHIQWQERDKQCVVLGDFGLSRNLKVCFLSTLHWNFRATVKVSIPFLSLDLAIVQNCVTLASHGRG